MLDASIQYLKGVGPKKIVAYQKLNIQTVEDLLLHFPRDYQDRTHIVPIDELVLQENNCFVAMVASPVREIRVKGYKSMCKTTLADDTGMISATFFNQPYLKNALKSGNYYLFFGKVTGTLLHKEIISPELKPLPSNKISPALSEILPIYSRCEGISQNDLRKQITQSLADSQEELHDYLPSALIEEYALSSYKQAITTIHKPTNFVELERAKTRLCFDELFILSLSMLRMKGRRQEIHTDKQLTDTDLEGFYQLLPYTLTGAQQKSILDVVKDMQKNTPMNRLVQGDVGCGKTMVAFASLYLACKNGYQASLMAPTEILAKQHYENLLALPQLNLRVALLTGSMTKKQKEGVKTQLKEGTLDVVIGTHALIEQDVEFKNLSLVITDEQHRFGVNQRSRFADKGGTPHILVMSATPIPRSLSFVIYGDLDVSIIDEMPPNRQSVKTHLIGENKRDGLYGFVAEEVKNGHQAFFVCPLVTESEKIDLQSAIEFAEHLQTKVFPSLVVKCIHGKMKQKEKDEIMNHFAQNNIQILVSTTVIEVGIDIPNATVMVIEDANRFGLSQLHQLRGRVGRGKAKAYCFLIADHLNEVGKKRLSIMCKTSDGFLIAKEDLKLRGPGDFFGNRQHGLPQLKIADIFSDTQTMGLAKQAAETLLEGDPTLSKKEHMGIGKKCKQFLHNMERTNTFN